MKSSLNPLDYAYLIDNLYCVNVLLFFVFGFLGFQSY